MARPERAAARTRWDTTIWDFFLAKIPENPRSAAGTARGAAHLRNPWVPYLRPCSRVMKAETSSSIAASIGGALAPAGDVLKGLRRARRCPDGARRLPPLVIEPVRQERPRGRLPFLGVPDANVMALTAHRAIGVDGDLVGDAGCQRGIRVALGPAEGSCNP